MKLIDRDLRNTSRPMSSAEEGAEKKGESPAPIPSALELQALQTVVHSIDNKRAAKEKYAFWETQPVAQFKEGDEPVALRTDLSCAGASGNFLRATWCAAGRWSYR